MKELTKVPKMQIGAKITTPSIDELKRKTRPESRLKSRVELFSIFAFETD